MTRLLTNALALTALLTPHSVQAQSTCGSRDYIIRTFISLHGETQVGLGLAGPSTVVELWASNETNTWTITQTSLNGITCIVSAGSDWQSNITNSTPIHYMQRGALTNDFK